MISIKGLCAILGIPLAMLVAALRTVLFGGWLRKYRNSPLNMAKLLMAKQALEVPVPDAKYVVPVSNMTMINTIVGGLFKTVTSSIPGYGKRYDENGIWIAQPPMATGSDPLIIYLHGGGYFLQTTPSQLQSLIATYKLLGRNDVSIIHLDYDLASEGFTIPHQLNQLVALYTKLVADGYTNITLMGDLAGGNLAIAFMAHLYRTQLKLPPPANLVLISPWVKLTIPKSQFTPGNLFYDNDGRDMITYTGFADPLKIVAITGNSEIASLECSPGNHPYSYDDWNLPSLKKGNTFVICGEDEVFRDDVLEWAKYALRAPMYDNKKQLGNSGGKLDRSIHEFHRTTPEGGKIEVHIEPWGVHDACLIFENSLLRDIKRNPQLKFRDVDREKYFGLTRLVAFLDQVL